MAMADRIRASVTKNSVNHWGEGLYHFSSGERPVAFYSRGGAEARRRGGAERAGCASASGTRSSSAAAAPSVMRSGLPAGRYHSAPPHEL